MLLLILVLFVCIAAIVGCIWVLRGARSGFQLAYRISEAVITRPLTEDNVLLTDCGRFVFAKEDDYIRKMFEEKTLTVGAKVRLKTDLASRVTTFVKIIESAK